MILFLLNKVSCPLNISMFMINLGAKKITKTSRNKSLSNLNNSSNNLKKSRHGKTTSLSRTSSFNKPRFGKATSKAKNVTRSSRKKSRLDRASSVTSLLHAQQETAQTMYPYSSNSEFIKHPSLIREPYKS